VSSRPPNDAQPPTGPPSNRNRAGRLPGRGRRLRAAQLFSENPVYQPRMNSRPICSTRFSTLKGGDGVNTHLARKSLDVLAGLRRLQRQTGQPFPFVGVGH